jgi:hypothetical protein
MWNHQVLDASGSTFNKIGRDQYNLHNCCVNFVDHHYHNHFDFRETLVSNTLMFIGPCSSNC